MSINLALLSYCILLANIPVLFYLSIYFLCISCLFHSRPHLGTRFIVDGVFFFIYWRLSREKCSVSWSRDYLDEQCSLFCNKLHFRADEQLTCYLMTSNWFAGVKFSSQRKLTSALPHQFPGPLPLRK